MQKEKGKKGSDIQARTFDFALRIIEVSRLLPRTTAGEIVTKQLVRSGTSVGANVEEAQAGYSRDDFAHKMNIALKEARETHYWLRLAAAGGLLQVEEIEPVIREAQELKQILGAIVSRTRAVKR